MTTLEGKLPLVIPWDHARWAFGALVASVVVWAFLATGGGDSTLVNPAGAGLLMRFGAAALDPTLDAGTLQLAAHAALTTLTIAACGAVLSAAIGFVAGPWASESFWRLIGFNSRWLRAAGLWPVRTVRAALCIPRGIPEIIWGLLLINVLGLDPLVAVLAIGLPFGAITAHVFADLIDETPLTAALAYRASGSGALPAFAYGVWPRVAPSLLAYVCYRVECALRSAAVLGFIGAGGLGYQIILSLDSLRFSDVWTFLYVLMVLVAGSDLLGSRATRTLQGHAAVTAAQLDRRARRLTLLVGAGGLLLLASAVHLGLDPSQILEPRRRALLRELLVAAWPPHLTVDEAGVLLTLSLETLAMSIVAISIAGLLALVASWCATPSLLSDNPAPGSRLFAFCVRAAMIVTRSLSDGIWVLLSLVVFFPGPLAGALALAAYNVGVLGRLFTQLNQAADVKPLRGLLRQGAPMVSAFAYALMPGMLPKYLAILLYRWEVCLRATMIVGIVGAGGLGRRLQEQSIAFDYRGSAATLCCYIALTILVDTVSGFVRRRLRTAG